MRSLRLASLRVNAISDELLALRQDLNLHHPAIKQIEFTRLNFAERVVDLVTEEYFRRFADAHQRGEAAALFEQVDDAIGEFLCCGTSMSGATTTPQSTPVLSA